MPRFAGGWNYYADEREATGIPYWNDGVDTDGRAQAGPLTFRYDGQPRTSEYMEYGDPLHFAASPLMMGQWNFTLTSATAKRMAKFVNVMGVTNCSDTFGYVNEVGSAVALFPGGHQGLGHYVGDWDSLPNMVG
jgi:hypothetical protein